ncbi:MULTISPECIES: anti-sigma factor [unclassified Agromyces]|uniref:anti-sigma factor n=1 Tax=unclassified Agromyces TaxID=2639701 RepID=UPI00301474A0
MDHIEPEELAVLALDGREPDAAVRAHLDGCPDCLAEYDTLVRTVAFGRGTPDDAFEAPPSSVWAAIHSELGLAPELAADPTAGRTRVAVAEAPARSTSAAPAERSDHVPRRRRSRRPSLASDGPDGTRRRSAWLPITVAAAAGGILAGVGLGWLLGAAGSGPAEPDPAVVLASAELDSFPGWDDAVGSATVEEVDGTRTVVVDLDATVPAGEVREVWLIRSDASGLVSLGLLEGANGRFTVPEGIDLDEFTLVDVSAEPVDGDPAHSGDSIVRGELRST